MSEPATSNARVLRFGALELDVRAGELRKHGIRVRLAEQPFQILLMLLHKPGEVVLRDDIRQRLWPNNTIVEFDHSINAAINRLRVALGETAERPRYIETVGSRGYRFVGEVEASDAPAKVEPADGEPTPAPQSRLDADDLAGRTVAHYKLVDQLGTGGMGVVYRAEDLRLGRQVALKFLPGEMAADPVARQRFEREVRLASALSHPNICTIYGVEESEGRLFLAMELLDGMTLQARLADGPLARPQALSYAAQICCALDAAHRRGLVHRDVKPANVMLTGVGVKVLDFGLAKMQPAVPKPEEAGEGITETGTLLGTVQYMSPEQVEGKDADTRSDIFSFGLVLYEMLTGRRAFEPPGRAQLIAAILQKEPVWGELPPELERVVRKCLAKDPDARWQSAADLRDELEWVSVRRPKLRLPGKRTAAIAAVAAVFFAAGIFVADRPFVDISQVRFTAMVMDPGYNNFPSWSPDGRSFVYMHSGLLMLRSLDAPMPVRVTSGSSAVVFSKDGTRLYYTREAAPATGRKLWTVAVTGGNPQPLPAADLGGHYLFDGIAMSPDRNAIIGLKQEPGGRDYSLQSSSPPGEVWSRLPCPAFQGPFSIAHLRFSPDGRHLLLALGSQTWVLGWPPVERRPPRLAFPPLSASNGADWMSDSRHVLMHLAGREEGQGGGLYIGDTETGRLYPLELSDSKARQPSAGPNGKFLVPVDDQDSDIIEIPLDGSPLRPLIATKRDERSPDWSHAGDQLVYLTARNGAGEIWIWSRANNLYRPLATKLALPSGTTGLADPVFSPDDRRVAFSTGQGRIFVIPSAGGTPVPIASAGGGAPSETDLTISPSSASNVLSTERRMAFPTWSPDGQWLAYRANRGGKLFLEKVRLGDPEHPVTVGETVQGVRPLWSPDGRWITLATREGVSVISPDGRIAKHVHGPVSSWTSTGWSRDGRILYLAVTDGYTDAITAAMWAIHPDTGEERVIGRYAGVWFGGSPSYNLSPSPDGKSLAATMTKPYLYIWLIEGLTPPQSFWGRLLSPSFQHVR